MLLAVKTHKRWLASFDQYIASLILAGLLLDKLSVQSPVFFFQSVFASTSRM